MQGLKVYKIFFPRNFFFFFKYFCQNLCCNTNSCLIIILFFLKQKLFLFWTSLYLTDHAYTHLKKSKEHHKNISIIAGLGKMVRFEQLIFHWFAPVWLNSLKQTLNHLHKPDEPFYCFYQGCVELYIHSQCIPGAFAD